jgi:predicted nucleic acid-binding protein
LDANFWTDAYLAAFARSAGLRLVTFDRGFARFSGLEVLLLASPTAPRSQ